MRFTTSVLSNIGGRDKNEDFADYFYKDDCGGVWVLADGLGGHKDGEVASRLAVETALKEFQSKSLLTVENIESIFYAANNAVIGSKINEKSKNGMKTTMVALFTDLKDVLWAHVGDSRLYFFRKGEPLFQTKDHSVSQMAVTLGEIATDQIRFHEDRNRLLRVLGNTPEVKVEILSALVNVNAQDAFLLCSDGFWELVYELEMEIDLYKSNSPKEWLGYMSERICKRLNNGSDNFSVIAVFVEE